MLRIAITVALPLLLAAPALAQDQKREPERDTANDTEIVCKYQTKSASRFRHKVCRTRAQWERMYQVARDQAAEGFNKPVILIGGG